jgi:hypothetical protein
MFIDADKAAVSSRVIWLRWLITVVCAGGGCVGAISCLVAIQQVGSTKQVVAIMVLLSLYLIGVAAGSIRGEYPKIAYRLCQIFFWAQIPVIQSPQLTYHLSSLVSYSVTYSPTAQTLVFSWYLGGDWELTLIRGSSTVFYGVNLFAIGLLSLNALAFRTRARPRVDK